MHSWENYAHSSWATIDGEVKPLHLVHYRIQGQKELRLTTQVVLLATQTMFSQPELPARSSINSFNISAESPGCASTRV